MYIYDELSNEWIHHRNTAEYHRRKSNVRDIWLILIIAMLFLPAAINIITIFFAAFATLTYLDENNYAEEQLY